MDKGKIWMILMVIGLIISLSLFYLGNRSYTLKLNELEQSNRELQIELQNLKFTINQLIERYESKLENATNVFEGAETRGFVGNKTEWSSWYPPEIWELVERWDVLKGVLHHDSEEPDYMWRLTLENSTQVILILPDHLLPRLYYEDRPYKYPIIVEGYWEDDFAYSNFMVDTMTAILQ